MEDGELDFMKIVRSIEELLYEAITWLLFYPLTLWRCVRHPGTLTAYTTEELQDAPDQQFTENISPPLFLMLSVLVAHLVELSLGLRTDATADMSRGARVVQERAAAQVFTLRLPAATAAQQAQLGALGPALAGKVLQRCEEP